MINTRFLLAIAATGAAVMIVAQGAPPRVSDPKTKSLSNIKQLGTAMMIYGADWDDVFPYPQSEKAWQYCLFPYTKNRDFFKTLNPAKPGNFKFNMALGGVSMTVIESPAETVMFYDPTVWPDGKYLFSAVDTSSRYVDAAAWKKLQKTLTLKLKKEAKRPLPKNYGAKF